ncbi:hypothetical protein BC835DRAFT_256503 [Cytidiella melzeri]|nr:hypothetical protein BC835DRAFT_256503 [Cytidiella melzeri]
MHFCVFMTSMRTLGKPHDVLVLRIFCLMSWRWVPAQPFPQCSPKFNAICHFVSNHRQSMVCRSCQLQNSWQSILNICANMGLGGRTA